MVIALSDKQKQSAVLETVDFLLYFWKYKEKYTGDTQVLVVMTKKGEYSVKKYLTHKIIHLCDF